MRNSRSIEDELDAIRVDLYEKTKAMTSEERVSYIKAQIAPTREKYGIHTINRVNAGKPIQ
jgi:hypothetical protein